MVGNLWEFVADWDEEASNCTNWPTGFGSDLTCLGEGTSRFPGAVIRGGDFDDGTGAGPFAVFARERPSTSFDNLGFRGAR
jgi:formylglycine-generating enzyme required for sulfatase activity